MASGPAEADTRQRLLRTVKKESGSCGDRLLVAMTTAIKGASHLSQVDNGSQEYLLNINYVPGAALGTVEKVQSDIPAHMLS